MKRNLLCILLIAPALMAHAYSTTMANSVKGEYAGKADSLTACLIDQFMNKTKGTFYSTPGDIEKSSTYIYWQQAHAMDVVIQGYLRHKGDESGLATRYRLYMTRWYSNHANNYSGGSTGFENPYTDDMCWICLTLMHLSEALETNTYFATAKKVFDSSIMKRATEDDSGLWLPWNSDAGSGPNACTMAPACLIACKMYEKYGTEKYLTYAQKLYDYMEAHIVKSDGRVEEPPLTYTQGTFAEACRYLYHITDEMKYRTKAQTYVTYAFTSGRCTNGSNILRHEGTSMDQSIFKAVLMPYAVNYVLDESMLITNRRQLSTYIQKNANSLWKVLDKEAYPKMYCPYDWTQAYDASGTASMGAMASGASLLENTARMCIALTTKDETGIQVPLAAPQLGVSGIYTLDGRLVSANSEDTHHLPSGMYIIDSKKVFVK